MIRILHVDDEVGFLDLVGFFLKREGDFEVDTATDAESALAKMQSQSYDAIIADYSLPGMDGIEMLKILRAKGQRTPFILFTGKGREETAVQALNSGADFYLQKGANPNLQFAELANMLRRSVRSARSEEAILDGERFLSSVFSSIQDGISVLDKDLNIIRVNNAMEDWYSHKMPLVGKKCYDAYHGRDTHCEVCPSIRTIESEKAAHEVVPKIGQKGEVVGWLDVFSFPMRDSKTGELRGVIEYVRDMTDRRKAELELHATLERYEELQAIINKSPAILVIWHPTLGLPVSFISDSIKQFGYNKDDFESTYVYDDIIHKDDLERNRMEFREHVASGANDFVQDYRVVTKSGDVRWVEDHTYVKRNADGSPVLYEGVVIDITPRKIAQQKSDELMSRLQAIIEAFPDLYFHVDADGTILDFNASRIADLYVPPQKFMGRRMMDVLPPDVGKMYDEGIRDALRTRKIVSLEYALDVEGETRFFEARLAPLPNENMLIVVRNITVRKRSQEALRASESRYRRLADSITDMFFALDKDMRYTYWNRASEELVGMSAKEIVGKSFVELFPDRQGEDVMGKYTEVFRTKKPMTFTFGCNIRGKDYLFEETAYPTDDGVSVISKDITERMETERALQERDTRYRKLSSHVPGMIYQFKRKPDGTYCVPFTTDAIRDIFGCSPEDVLEDFSPIARVILPEDYDRVVETIESSAKHLAPFKCEYRIRIPGKPVRWLFWQSTPEKQPDGSVIWHGFNTDITERKQAEDLLKTNEEKYRQLVELAQEGILMTDAANSVRFVNPRMTEMLGHSMEDIIGKSVLKLLDERSAELAMKKIEERKRGLTDRYELDFVRKDGTRMPASIGVAPIMDKEGRYSGALAVVIDMSDRKRYEEALEVANQKLNLLGQVTRHDALNQLGVLMGWLQIAQDTVVEPPLSDYLKNMRTAAETIVGQLDFTGDYQKMGVAKPEWIDVKAAFSKGTLGLGLGRIAKSVDVDGLEVYADPMFEKVFHNLADNSIRHGKKVTEIRVHYSKKGNELSLFYEDDGVGVPASEKEKLFRQGIGVHTGYGLFMVKAILGITGISIEENGKPDQGVRFEMCVPAGAFRMKKGAGHKKE